MSGRSVLITVLFTDIVRSTEVAGEMGDRRWRELLARHNRIVRSELRRFGGREIDTAGDGFFASFDRPAQAVRCASSIVRSVQTLGIDVRAGVHVGEAEVIGRGFGGMAVHTGARLASLAGPGEVLVTGTLKELVPGATFGFEDRGVRELKGIREAPRVFAVIEVDETPLGPPLPEEKARERRDAIAPQSASRRWRWIAGIAAVVIAVAAVTIFMSMTDDPVPAAGPVRDAVVVVDPEARRVGRPIPLPLSLQVSFEAHQVAVGEGGVWIMNGVCVCRIDPETNEVTRADVSLPNQLALGHRAVWVSSLDGAIVPVNPASVEASAPIALPGQIFHTSVTTTEDAVWIAFRNELARIDPVSEEISDSVQLEHGADDVVGVGPDVWVIDQLRRALHRYGSNGDRISSVELNFTPDDVAAGTDGSLWVLNRPGGTVTRVDVEGRLGQPIRVPADTSDVAVGPDAVWVADHGGRTIQRIDPELGQTDEPIGLPGPVAAIGVDQETGEVWAFID